MYHEVAKPEDMQALSRVTQSNYVLTVDEFSAHMDILAREGCTPISLDDLVRWQQGMMALPTNPIVITFDDGFVGNERHALPILVEHRFHATFFIVTERVDTPHMMSWDQLRKLSAAGMAVESHTATHPLFSTIDADRTRRELVDSKRSIEAHLGTEVRHVSLPFGDSNDFVSKTAAAVGYQSACSSLLGFNRRDTDAFELRRFAMTNTLSAADFTAIARADAGKISGMLRRAEFKRGVARFLGKKNYDRLVNLWYGVSGPESASRP